MFGYITANSASLTQEQKLRFRAVYCGMCKTLHERYGNLSRFTLSYDMTFLALLLSALYEPKEERGAERCLLHPFRAHEYAVTPFSAYAVDLNVALAYHKCRDNRQDERSPFRAIPELAMRRAYAKACERIPKQCEVIEQWMNAIAEIERSGREELDPPMNLTGSMLGRLLCYKDDCWSELLMQLGEGLGRFIYFMDAYEDLQDDVRKHKFNPLKSLMQQQDFDELCKQGLTMMMAQSADAFERLPILQDAELIRNILYSGVWARMGNIQAKKAKRKGTK